MFESGAATMKILKQKSEATATVTIRVPASLKTELDSLRKQCNHAGFDLNASLTDAMVKTIKQIRAEIDQLKQDVARPATADGMVKLS
jgi:hypothetical protein